MTATSGSTRRCGTAAVALVKLRDSAYAVANQGEDVRQRTLYTSEGAKIGRVDALYIDETSLTVRYLRVASGGVFGFGTTHYLIPVEAIVAVREDSVYVDQLQPMPGARRYAPRLVERSRSDAALAYWAAAPFWVGGYLPPEPGPHRSRDLPPLPLRDDAPQRV